MHSALPPAQSEANPLAGVPREIADRLRPHFDATIDDIVASIQSRVAEYARPSDQIYLKATRESVRDALCVFLDRIGAPDPPGDELRDRFRALGAGEAHEGRSLDSLQTAMRTAAVIAWRRITAIQMAEPLTFPRHYIGPMAEAAFLFLEEIAAASMEGYSAAQAQAAGELQRRRGRLVNLLLADDPPAPEAVAGLARAAEWRVPAEVAVVALHGRDSDTAGTPVLPPDVLADFNRADPCLVVPDPEGPGRLRTLGLALRDWDAAAGPTVGVTDAAASLARAQDTLALLTAGVVPRDGIARWTDHLTALLLFRDEALMRAMARSRLAPLQELRPAQRERLAETLLAWLQSGFNANEVAARLHVHPQTVRYRLRQVESLFGDRLRDPDQRFELEMVLRMQRLSDAAAEAPGRDRARGAARVEPPSG
ncbi:PucR family transcriptional regulator [Nocardiopsis trehalosi]|uniref:PucR family transcriptional regulator n=1 Tax=Nocardiopsis trehalosi TaxID=109329 RepID=UPI000AA52722|nr:PucR family transcriptional regulator [Nocardiopsis trehalosi]